MEIQKVAELIVYVVLLLLALDRGWSMLKRQNGDTATSKKTTAALQHEVDDMRRATVDRTLAEILSQAKDNHEDIGLFREESRIQRMEILERLRNLEKRG